MYNIFYILYFYISFVKASEEVYNVIAFKDNHEKLVIIIFY